MNEQDKELLLMKDLCARLPYGVMVEMKFSFTPAKVVNVFYKVGKPCVTTELGIVDDRMVYETHFVESVKPYLRPMSSMTEEELKELENVASLSLYDNEDGEVLNGKTITNGADVDWLNAHHFDFRGLIEKGLALPAPEEMYNFKQLKL